MIDLKAIVEERAWAEASEKIDRIRTRLRERVHELGTASQLEHLAEALKGNLSSVAAELYDTARVSWLMTKGDSPLDKKKELSAKLAAAYKVHAKRFTKIVEAGMARADRRSLRNLVSGKIDSIGDAVIRRFDADGDPLEMIGGKILASREARATKKIVFLSADASRTPDGQRPQSAINIDVEFREIEKAIRSATLREYVELVPVLATTKEDFVQALNQHEPTIVHFSGHGGQTGGILFTNNTGTVEPAGTDFLREVFLTCPSVQLVVLNACFSFDQAHAVSQVVGPTVGTPDTLSDEKAVEFSRALYSSLASGRSVQQAFDQASAFFIGSPKIHSPTIANDLARDLDKLTLIKKLDQADLSAFISKLRIANSRFNSRDERLTELLTQARIFSQIASPNPLDMAQLLPKDELVRFFESPHVNRISEVLDYEVGKVEDYSDELDRLFRYWTTHLPAEAVGHLAKLEQSVGDEKRSLRLLQRQVSNSLPAVRRMIDAGDINGAQSVMTSFASLLAQFGGTMKTLRSKVDLHYSDLMQSVEPEV